MRKVQVSHFERQRPVREYHPLMPPKGTRTLTTSSGYLPRFLPRSSIRSLRNTLRRSRGQPRTHTRLSEAVKVQFHTSEDVETPHSVQNRGSSIDTHRGATTSFPHEPGNNLPLLHTRLDSRGLPPYAEMWCANLRLGTNRNILTKGIARYYPLERFQQIADSEK